MPSFNHVSRTRMARILLACARDIVAYLTDNQKKMVERAQKRSMGIDFGTAFDWDPSGRAYIPVSRTIRDIQAPQEIVDALKKLGYSITSYRDGEAIKTIEVRDGKKTQKKGIGKILKNEVRDESLYKLFMNRLGTSNKQDNRNYAICITHNPEDVGAMSTGRNWTSCMHLPEKDKDSGGQYYYTALRQVQYGGMCAYLIEEGDWGVAYPFARIALKRLENNAGGFIYQAESRIYGDEDLANECGMMQMVKSELDKANAKTQKSGGIFNTTDDLSYTDGGITSRVMPIDLNDKEAFSKMTAEKFKDYFDQCYGDNHGGEYDWLDLVEAYMDANGINEREDTVQWVLRYCDTHKFGMHMTKKFLDKYGDDVDWKYASICFLDPSWTDLLEKHKHDIWWTGFLKTIDAADAERLREKYAEYLEYENEEYREYPLIDPGYDWGEYIEGVMSQYAPSSMIGSDISVENYETSCQVKWYDSCDGSWLFHSSDKDIIPRTMAMLRKREKQAAQDFANEHYPELSGEDILNNEAELSDEEEQELYELVESYLEDEYCEWTVSVEVLKNYHNTGACMVICRAICERDEIYRAEKIIDTQEECEGIIRDMVDRAFTDFPSVY